MNKEYIIKHNLMEAHKQFMRLSEGYLATSIVEDDEENEVNNASEGEGDDQNGLAGGNDQNNLDGLGDPNSLGQEADRTNGQPEPMNNQDGMDDLNGEQPPMPPEQPMPEMDDIEPESEDDVLDVEDLTQAQEKLNKKQNSLGHDLNDVDDRIIALLTAVEKIKGSIDKNNQDITALKQELEKRVPTDTEKLNMQSLKMYPFNVNPTDYWRDKEKDGRYEAEGDEEKKEYKITRDDVDSYADRDIENSFDDELNQTMKDIFKGF